MLILYCTKIRETIKEETKESIIYEWPSTNISMFWNNQPISY